MFKLDDKRIWVAGHTGMVGSAVLRKLNLLGLNTLSVERDDLDLTRQTAVEQWVKKNKPDVVVVCAAKVGGIKANNDYPADFIWQNLVIETNIIHSAFMHGVEKLLFLGSSCIYPKFSEQPILESELLTGSLEETNEWYAIAKIAGVKLCQAYRKQHGCDFISAMPTNLYGPNDNFDLDTSHVVPALIRKAHEAMTNGHSDFEVWGSGNVRREFLHVSDCADAIVHLLQHYSDDVHINIGTGQDVTIRELAEVVKSCVGFQGSLKFNADKPDGTPRKLLDVSKIHSLGWKHSIVLKDGISDAYNSYVSTHA